MATPNPKDYTYNTAKEIQEMLYTLRTFQSNYCDIIKIVDTKNHMFYIDDINHNEFHFLINYPDIKSKATPTKFPIQYKPSNHDSKGVTSGELEKDSIIKHLSNWVKVIKDYNTVNFNQEDVFLNFYEEEIFSEFEIIDDDAETKPFDTNQQIILYTFLQATVEYLEKEYTNNEIVEEIINEANSLKNEIPSLTKRIASKRFSQILAKIRKFNPITFKDVYDVAKKEVIKYLLLKGVETLPKLINSITAFIGS